MPAIAKIPIPVKEPVFPLRALQDYLELNSYFNYRTLARSFPHSNGFESNHMGVVQAVYRKQGPKLDSCSLNKPNQVKWFTEKLPLNANSVVLDVNCGTGLIARSLAPNVKKVYGTDISRHLIAHAKSRPQDNLEFTRAESSDLPYEDSTFDVVFSRMSFNHLSDRMEALAEMRRVCKPGGYIALMERVIPDELDDPTIIRMEFIEGVRDPSHLYFLTPAEMNALFKENNIDVLSKETTTCPQPYEEYLARTNVIQKDRAAISQYVYGNMITPDPEDDHTTGLYPHMDNDEVTITHHLAMIGGTNPVEKPQIKDKE